MTAKIINVTNNISITASILAKAQTPCREYASCSADIIISTKIMGIKILAVLIILQLLRTIAVLLAYSLKCKLPSGRAKIFNATNIISTP